jgi:hypothetical protein
MHNYQMAVLMQAADLTGDGSQGQDSEIVLQTLPTVFRADVVSDLERTGYMRQHHNQSSSGAD